MHGIKKMVMAMVMLSSCMLPACATIQSGDQVRAVREHSFGRPGDAVHLFYGMNAQAREEFRPGAVVPVYRMGRGYDLGRNEVGKVKVSKALGDHYLEAVVTEGEIRPDDIAKQADSGCLIRSPEQEKTERRYNTVWGL